MSFREKSAWISLITTLLIWGGYFVEVWRGAAAGTASDGWPMALFIEAVIASVVVQGILTAVAALRIDKAERDRPDEREIRIEGRATGVAYTIVTVLVVTLAIASPLVIGIDTGGGGVERLPLPAGFDPTLIMANGLLLAVLSAEVARSSIVVALHRLGRA